MKAAFLAVLLAIMATANAVDLFGKRCRYNEDCPRSQICCGKSNGVGHCCDVPLIEVVFEKGKRCRYHVDCRITKNCCDRVYNDGVGHCCNVGPTDKDRRCRFKVDCPPHEECCFKIHGTGFCCKMGIPQPYPIGSKDREKRIKAIAKEMASGNYDLVALQEIWSEDDFKIILEQVKEALPYGHYFHSGFTGSGVCVFSRKAIKDTLMHRYSLNGFAHHIHRGDWFGGKVIGMVRTSFHGVTINFYSTHNVAHAWVGSPSRQYVRVSEFQIHAEYDRTNDLYLPHRVVQAFEMSQFIKATSSSADVSIVTGDLNLEAQDLGYQLVTNNAELEDAWVTRGNKDVGDSGNTCDIPSNSYVKTETLKEWPDGKRIDYILYHHSKSLVVNVDTCKVTMGRIPGDTINYSDHEGLYAELKVSKGDDAAKNAYRKEQREIAKLLRPLLENSVGVMELGQSRVRSDRRFFIGSIVGLVIVLLYTYNLELSFPSLTVLALTLRFLVVLVLGFSTWYGLVGLTLEEKALKAAKAGMTILLKDEEEDDN